MAHTDSSLLIAIIVACVLAVAALIISIVSLRQNGGLDVNVFLDSQKANTNMDDCVWQIAFHEHDTNLGYIDEESGEFRGFLPDMATAVCQIADKNCEMVFDRRQRCWNSKAGARPEGGVGLFGRYYDACIGYIQTYERDRVFKFADPYSNPVLTVFVVKKENTDFDWRDLTGNKIGILEGSAFDEHCIAREKGVVTGSDLTPDQIVYYNLRQDLYDGLMAGEVDAAFDYDQSWIPSDPMTKVASDPIAACVKGGVSMMMRRDSRLDEWWNPAFATLMASSQWKEVCDDLKISHGDHGGPAPENFCLGY